MTKPTKRQVAARVRYWKKRMGLDAWKLTVVYGKDEDGAEASCLAAPEYLCASLHFDLDQIDVAELDAYVIHEAAHCLIWPLANAGHSLAKGDAAGEEWIRTEEERLATALERLVQQFAA